MFKQPNDHNNDDDDEEEEDDDGSDDCRDSGLRRSSCRGAQTIGLFT